MCDSNKIEYKWWGFSSPNLYFDENMNHIDFDKISPEEGAKYLFTPFWELVYEEHSPGKWTLKGSKCMKTASPEYYAKGLKVLKERREEQNKG
jgi:hypothetical protein